MFGINSSPFQAQFVSRTHAQKHKDELPLAAEAVSKSTYMDDRMDSMIDDSQGIKLYKQLDELRSKAGMHARKSVSNSSQVLEKIPIKDKASEVDINKDPLPTVKTMGITWLPEEDLFTFKANAPEENFQLTKRNFLRRIATLFDPVGFGCGWRDLNGTNFAKGSWFTSLKNGSAGKKTFKFPNVYGLAQNKLYCQRLYTPLSTHRKQ